MPQNLRRFEKRNAAQKGTYTSKNWAAINKCSSDTANRDIQDLVAKGVLRVDVPGAKRPSYSIINIGMTENIASQFTDVHITTNGSTNYLEAIFKQSTPVR